MEYRVAVATSDGRQVDQHFAQAADFLVVTVESETGALHPEGRRAAPRGETGPEQVGATCIGTDPQRLDRTGAALADCRYLLVSAIGRKPQSVLLRHGVSALETDGDIAPAIARLNTYVTRGPAPGSFAVRRLGDNPDGFAAAGCCGLPPQPSTTIEGSQP